MDTKEKKVPKIRFPGFTDDWEQRKLEEVVGVYDGVHQTPQYTESGVMFLSVENIATLTSQKYISEEAFERDYKVYPQKGDVLMTRIGDVGTPNIVETLEKLAFYVSLALLKPTNIDSYFLCNSIQSPRFKKGLKDRTLVTAIPQKINKDEIGKVDILMPSSRSEQIQIGVYFRQLDNLITLHQRELKNLETQKKAVMKKIFSQEVRFKRDDGTNFPEWEEDTLGNHCTFYNGDRGKNYPSASDYVVEGLPFINAGDLDGKHISEKCAKISEEKYNQLGGAKLVRNDILYCLRGSLGKMGIVDFDTGGTVASSLVAIRAKDVDYLYMYYFLRSPLEYEQRKVNDEGLAQPNLSAKNVGGYLMPIPCLEEQRLIADFLSDFDEAIAVAKKELELWKELKKGLLQQMFV